jgi:hypothetical protein
LQASFNIPTPGKEGGYATLTQVKPESQAPADKPVDAPTMAHASRVGLKLSGKETNIEANNLIADKEALDKAAELAMREKKLSKPTGRAANTVGGEITDWMQLEDAANRALAYDDSMGGPLQGSALAIPYTGIRDYFKGTDVLSQRYEYSGLVATVASAKRKLQSGAAVTPQEGVWIAPLIPSATDLDTKRRTNLTELSNGARKAYMGRAQAAGLTDSDLDEIRRRMGNQLASLPTRPSDIPLGSTP